MQPTCIIFSYATLPSHFLTPATDSFSILMFVPASCSMNGFSLFPKTTFTTLSS